MTGLSADVRARLERAVDERFAAQLEFLQEFVRHPSTRGNERDAQLFVAEALAERGYAVDEWVVDPADIATVAGASPVAVDYGRTTTVVGALPSRSASGRSLIIQGHCDVVPEGPRDMWSDDPYSGLIRDGWLYGRGAGDMKAGFTAGLFALDALRAIGVRPAGDVWLQSVPEEESTGNGAVSTIQRGYRADAVLIPESSGFRLARAQVGVLWLKVSVRGRPAHAGLATRGANAIEAAFELVAALKDLEAEWNRRAASDPFFADVEHPVNINLGTISGGDWASSVPSWCELELRIGFLPSQDAAAAQAEVVAVLADAAARIPFLREAPPTLEWHGFVAPGALVLGEDDPAAAALARAHELVSGEPLERWDLTTTTDCRVYAAHGMPALCYGATAVDFHGADERVEVESIRRLTLTIAAFVAEWCGLDEV